MPEITRQRKNPQSAIRNPQFFFFLFACLGLLWQCAAAKQQPAPAQPVRFAENPRNVILMIGDGMALSQISAGIYWKGVGKSAFEQFPVVGFHKSHASDNKVTDSAAGATAFACGHKTYNGAIGVLPDDAPCQTLLEDLSHAGFASGMVVTCSATHATPAAFIAHQKIRAFSENIALDYLQTPLDCFVGGGQGYFTDRPDKLNLQDSLKKRGYVVKSGTSFRGLPLDGAAPFMLFTAPKEPPTATAGRRYLAPATEMSCQFLKKRNKQGFFLMVEGSQIDWALHANDRNWLKAEMLDFEAAVQKALDFAAADGETLVLVTGDHECGGLALHAGPRATDIQPAFASKMHTAALTPVLAFGPQAALFSGIYDNTEVYLKMRRALKK
jgi:alkaline phosphatase